MPAVPVQFDEEPPAMRRAPSTARTPRRCCSTSATTGRTSPGSRGRGSSHEQHQLGRSRSPTSSPLPTGRPRADTSWPAALRRLRHVQPPAEPRLPGCHSTEPGFRWEEVDGAGSDPVLDRHAPVLPAGLRRRRALRAGRRRARRCRPSLRMIGRLLDGPRLAVGLGQRVRLGFEDIAEGVAVPAFALEPAMSGRFTASRKVAIVGYAQSPAQRHADVPLGALAVETARRRHRGRRPRGVAVDGFVRPRCCPPAGRTRQRTASASSPPTGSPPASGSSPAYAAGFQGFGQIPGSVSIAVNALASGAADYVLVHRALHNPPGRYHENPMTRGRRLPAVDGAPGLLRPLVDDRPALQRVPPALRRDPGVHGGGLVEAGRTARGSRGPTGTASRSPREEYLAAPMINDPICRFDCDIPVDGVAAFVLTSAERAHDLPHQPGLRCRLRQRRPRRSSTALALAARRRHGGRRGAGATALGPRRRLSPPRSTCRRSTTAFPPSCTSGWRCSGSAARGGAPLALEGGIDTDRPGAAPDPLRRRGPRQRADARRAADARVLPPALRPSRRAPAEHDGRGRLPLLPPLRGRRRLQLGAQMMAAGPRAVPRPEPGGP